MTSRLYLLQHWLANLFASDNLSFVQKSATGRISYQLTTASSDASFRRYYRIVIENPKQSFIVMDAPPEKENCLPFVKIAIAFQQTHIRTPKIFAEDIQQGFLLLEDFGDTSLLNALHNISAKLSQKSQFQKNEIDLLYQHAIKTLVQIQQNMAELPAYDEELLMREMMLFPDWYLSKHLGICLSDDQLKALQTCFIKLIKRILQQPIVCVHRDYHSRNLMVLENVTDGYAIGVLDFQDAVMGAVSYDLVSLLKDAYFSLSSEKIKEYVNYYWQLARQCDIGLSDDFAKFQQDFEWMGVQRHLKVLGIFARLYHRDGKSAYLENMPVVKRYLHTACSQDKALSELYLLLKEWL